MCFFVILLCQDCGEHFSSVPTGVEGGREGELECVRVCLCAWSERGRERDGAGGKERSSTQSTDKTIVVLASLTNICGLLQVMKTAWSFQTTADICYSV